MPTGSLFRISSPVAEFSAWTGTFGDVDVRRFTICNPLVLAERQRRTFDAPSQVPATEIAVNTLEAVGVEGVLVDRDLNDFVLAGGALPGSEALVQERQPIVWPRIPTGRAAT
jgi:hypothetical protein